MENIERRDREMAYISDRAVMEEQKRTRKILHRLNTVDPSDFDEIGRLVKELFGKSDKAFVNPPFYCDYGCHISVGDNFFANFDCILLDVNTITIGNNVLFGPRVCLFTAGHPLDAGVRREMLEFGKPIVIGDDVWIGGNVTVNPGVTIGSNVVIGSGSVVTKDIPSGVVAAGNPCRVLREFTDKDRAEWEAQKQAYWDSKK